MELEKIREKIDKLDDKIVMDLKKRQDLVEKAMSFKRERWMELRQKERETNVVNRAVELGKQGGLDPEYIEAIFKRVIRESLLHMERTHKKK